MSEASIKAREILTSRDLYVEARVGSANYRNKREGDPCRAVWKGARRNDAADELILLLAKRIDELENELKDRSFHEAALRGFYGEQPK